MTNEFFEPAFKGTNFGSKEYLRIVREGLLKVACHYWNGHTLTNILIGLGYRQKDDNELTNEGRKMLYELLKEVL
jgi:hypothetical protein